MTEGALWKTIGAVVGLAVGVVFFINVWIVAVPFVLGLVIAYLVNPLVERFVAMGYRRDRVVGILYTALLAAMGLSAVFLLPTFTREFNLLIADIPTYAASINELVARLNAGIQEILQRVIGMRAKNFYIPFQAEQFLETLVLQLPSKLLNFAHVGLWVLIVPFVAFFALNQGRKWIDFLFDTTPSEHVEGLLGFLAEINATLGGYIRGQLWEALCVGLATMGGLLVLGIDGAVLIGVLTGLMNPVPFMAPVVGGAIAVVVTLAQNHGASTIVGVILLFLIIRLLDDFVFIPFVMGHNVHLHPVVMLFAVLAGWHLGGFLGLVFAIPITAVIKVVLNIILRHRREKILINGHHVYS